MGEDLPYVDLLYVRQNMPNMVSKAERYNATRAEYIRARLDGQPSDHIRLRAEKLRDELASADKT